MYVLNGLADLLAKLSGAVTLCCRPSLQENKMTKIVYIKDGSKKIVPLGCGHIESDLVENGWEKENKQVGRKPKNKREEPKE